MQVDLDLICSPEEASNDDLLLTIAFAKSSTQASSYRGHFILRRSIDARKNPVKINLRIRLFLDEEPSLPELLNLDYKNVEDQKRILIIGCGPAGMFAALRCIELGLKPIIIERGKNVKDRRRDLKSINRDHKVNPESNYCFGEGGAGTYSDGKLYTRSKKRGSVNRILDILVQHGATREILIDAHPHIGTNKLPKVVQAMRERILEFGGEIHFNTKMVDLQIENNLITGIIDQNQNFHQAEGLILATGHSARDVFELLYHKKIKIEAKPFAMGVRVEHPQELIDKIQYHGFERGEVLPAASYKLVEQVENRGVYSFCMCPGGFIVPAATGSEELVVNGMSPSKRDNKFANSGIVVAIELEDLEEYKKYGPLAGLKYQQELEEKVWKNGGEDQTAPAQKLTDFVKGRISTELNPSSYMPGLKSVALHEILPKPISDRLRKGFMKFGDKMRGYYSDKANVIAIESRTSSPVKIPRDPKSLHHPQIKNLFPCGEGAGYAGGIVSAGIDGERCAEAISKMLETFNTNQV